MAENQQRLEHAATEDIKNITRCIKLIGRVTCRLQSEASAEKNAKDMQRAHSVVVGNTLQRR